MGVELEDVERWGGELRVLQTQLSPCFARSEPRQRVIAYLRGLLRDIPCKNGWQLAEQAGERTPNGMQRLLSSSHWSADAVRDALQSYEREQLSDREAVLVVDETGFLKIRRQIGRGEAPVQWDSGTDQELPNRGVLGLRQCAWTHPH